LDISVTPLYGVFVAHTVAQFVALVKSFLARPIQKGRGHFLKGRF
jgi:hypothetical protein